MWDIKPFAHGDRCVRVFQGAPHGLEQNLHACAWSKDNRYIGAAGGDRTVVMRSMGPWCNDVRSVLMPCVVATSHRRRVRQVVWDADTARMLYKLPGHKGSVVGVDFHPKEPIGADPCCWPRWPSAPPRC